MQKNEIVTLSVTEINNMGCGVAHLGDGRVVFIRDAVTGDEVEARIIKVNKSYLVARIERLVKPSPFRTEEELCHAAGCGGCVYRHITYEHELALKRDYVVNAFRKAGLPDAEVEPVRTTGATSGYRNKGQYPVAVGKDGKLRAGFYAAATHRVVPADTCALQPEIFARINARVCELCDARHVTAYDETTGKGLLRHIYLRRASATGEITLCLVLNGEKLPDEERFAETLTREFPEIVGVLINVNRENTNVILGEKYRIVRGRDYIEDRLCGLTFRVSAGAFYQVNHDACELLYGIAREKAGCDDRTTPEKIGTVLDLYCGIGTIGLSMAGYAEKVIGIEIVEEAVRRAAENAERNGVANAYFYCGDASDARCLLDAAEREHGDVTDAVIVMDPPRKGSTPELIDYLAERGFRRIVYVSCGPDTLARDCARFREHGYAIGTVTPVDMFPRTGHVESVCLLTKN